MTLRLLLLSLFALVPGSIQNRVQAQNSPALSPMKPLIKITVGSSSFTVELSRQKAAETFRAMLPLTLSMKDVNKNEKYARLPRELSAAASSSGAVHAGDLMLWGSDGLVLFYKTFPTSYHYTPLGHISDTSGLEKALGAGNVVITLERM